MSSVGKKRGAAEFVQWMNPLLKALRVLGGSARPREASEMIATALKIADSVLDATNKTGQGRFYNHVAWARQYLVWEGLLDGSRRGVWTLTPRGQSTNLTDADSRKLFLKWVKIHSESRKAALSGNDDKVVEVERMAPALAAMVPE